MYLQICEQPKENTLTPKASISLRNWPQHEKALRNRFSPTFWISEDLYHGWSHHGPKQRGAQFCYSQLAIETMLLLKELYHLTNRGTEGFVRSWFQSAGISLPVPGAEGKVLFFCLSVGSAMGGNGSLIGASANMVTAGISGGGGYPISYVYFLKKGFPALLITVALAFVWLVIRFL